MKPTMVATVGMTAGTQETFFLPVANPPNSTSATSGHSAITDVRRIWLTITNGTVRSASLMYRAGVE